jgi:hypothetical protein
MASAKELVYNIKNLKSGGKTSDDNPMSDMQWLFIIDYYRSQLIRQQQTANQTISEFIVQEVETGIKLCEFDDNLFESDKIIPKPIEIHKRDLILHVGGDDEISYQRLSFNNYLWKKHSRYTSKEKFYFIKNSKVILGNMLGRKNILVRGVFERPIDIVKLSTSYNVLDPLDFEYPVSNNMMDSIIKLISDAEMKILHMIPKDDFNDGLSN